MHIFKKNHKKPHKGQTELQIKVGFGGLWDKIFLDSHRSLWKEKANLLKEMGKKPQKH